MMKHISTTILFLFILLFHSTASAQNWDDIRTSELYLWGLGTGATVAEADQNALADLVSKISVHVKSQFDQDTEDVTTSGGQVDSSTKTLFRVKSYSQATLTNTERLVLSNEPDAEVGRYIKRSEVDRIFEGRRAKVKDMVDIAMRAEDDGKVDDALRHYYWAYLLLRSLPHSSEVRYRGEGLSVWIPQRMNRVFDDIRAEVVSRDGDDVILSFTFRDRPVTTLDYTYFDGANWSNIYSARNGRGVLELPGASADNIRLKYEYEYRGEARIDREVESVIGFEKALAMRKSYQNVSIAGASVTPVEQPENRTASDSHHTEGTANPVEADTSSDGGGTGEVKSEPTPPVAAGLSNAVARPQDYQAVVDKVVAAIASKRYDDALPCFTDDGKDIYKQLIRYGQARLVGETKCEFLPYRQWVMGRSVPMSFSFRGGVRKSFVEDVVFTFERETAKICNITFGLDHGSVSNIMGKSKWKAEHRMQIIDFLENYKTAYALKRLDYIESIFSDDALIITGRVVRVASSGPGREGQPRLPRTKVQFTKQTKEQYLRNLRASFASKEFINIHFTNSDVRVNGVNPNNYGIQVKQDYYSNNYGDTGYLFLMVNMENPDEPLITIRTWQPEPDPEFGIFGIEHF